MLRQRFNALIEKIKAHKIQVILWSVFILLIIILSFTLHWNRPPKETVIRTQLPQTASSTGLLSLITEPDQGVTPVLNLLNNAQKSIDLVMYQMTDKEISDALISARGRGLNVRVLLNLGYFGKKETTTNDLVYEYLQKGGVQVHWTPGSFALTHQKTLVIDNNKALIMTWNFVPKYYPTGRDFGILDADQTDVNAIEETFSADWNNQQISSSLGDDLVWSPTSENDMLLVIKNAKTSLDIYNEEINYQTITDALKDAHARGVTVRIIMTYSTANKPIFTDLINSGIQVHTYSGTKKLYIHAKSIVADKSYAFVGSENFSFNSLNKNLELGIFVKDSEIISSIENTFNSDWQNGKAFKI